MSSGPVARATPGCHSRKASGCFGATTTGSREEAVLGAYDAYRAGDAIKLARYSKKLEGHVLQPWLDYWRVALTLDDASAKDVHAYFNAHGNTYPAELLRADWLRVLGRRGAWQEFDRDATTY